MSEDAVFRPTFLPTQMRRLRISWGRSLSKAPQLSAAAAAAGAAHGTCGLTGAKPQLPAESKSPEHRREVAVGGQDWEDWPHELCDLARPLPLPGPQGLTGPAGEKLSLS